MPDAFPVATVAELQPRWLDLVGASAYCSLSTKSLRRMIASGRLLARRPVKGRVLVDRLALDALIAGSTGTPRTGRGRHA